MDAMLPCFVMALMLPALRIHISLTISHVMITYLQLLTTTASMEFALATDFVAIALLTLAKIVILLDNAVIAPAIIPLQGWSAALRSGIVI
jgi:hypothetical protein